MLVYVVYQCVPHEGDVVRTVVGDEGSALAAVQALSDDYSFGLIERWDTDTGRADPEYSRTFESPAYKRIQEGI